jgi:hypothetical protein
VVTDAVHIDPDAVYDDALLYAAMEVSAATLVVARREGRLRYSRQGRRILYLGRWVLEWLQADSRREVSHAS